MPAKSVVILATGAAAALLIAGCAKGNDQSSTTTTTTTATSSSPAAISTTTAASSMSGAVAQGDPARGKTIFTGNCAVCHGATGTEGGVGPSLKNEKSRKNYEQTIAWIHNPSPPMPKLWPAPLNDKDVADVAAYVQSL
jgi:mono/diheme cytochrome c family protein